MWAITLSGGALTVIFSFFFGMPDFRIHLAFSGILAISLALVMDFRGMKPPELVDRLYDRFFSDLPRESFDSIIVPSH
jgi:hypothetical protein